MNSSHGYQLYYTLSKVYFYDSILFLVTEFFLYPLHSQNLKFNYTQSQISLNIIIFNSQFYRFIYHHLIPILFLDDNWLTLLNDVSACKERMETLNKKTNFLIKDI